MNPIIQQLAEETVKAVQHNEFGVCDMNKYNQKFAELIVRECILVVEDSVNHREPASIYVHNIKQHFGI